MTQRSRTLHAEIHRERLDGLERAQSRGRGSLSEQDGSLVSPCPKVPPLTFR
jgi:hypothetical protein